MTWASEHRVGLWYVRTESVTDATLEAVRALLTSDERNRHLAYVSERNRHEYLVTRAIERGVLAKCLGKSPTELTFTRSEYGRPELAPRSSLHFSLANTVEMVACAVAHGREIGVDLEPVARGDRIMDLADTVFTATERAMLEGLNGDLRSQHRRALEVWTLKEAYIKARGMGMSIPVGQIEVRFEGSRPRGLRFHEGIADDPKRWLLATREVADHLVSVCVERRGGAEADLEIELQRAELGMLLTARSRS